MELFNVLSAINGCVKEKEPSQMALFNQIL